MLNWESDAPLKLVCAWCLTLMRDGPEPVSHGICPRCTKATFPDLKPGPIARVGLITDRNLKTDLTEDR